MSYYILYNTPPGHFPIHKTTEGRLAVHAFTSRDKAQAFKDAKGIECEVFEPAIEDFIYWLRKDCAQDMGITDIFVDPDPSQAVHPHRSILIFASEVEL